MRNVTIRRPASSAIVWYEALDRSERVHETRDLLLGNGTQGDTKSASLGNHEHPLLPKARGLTGRVLLKHGDEEPAVVARVT